MKNEMSTSWDCNDSEYQKEVLQAHAITQATFLAAVESFFYPSLPDSPEVISAEDIKEIIGDADCNEYALLLKGSDNPAYGNSDISIELISIPSSPPVLSGYICVLYSVQLFKGIFNIHDADSFAFSKANNSNSQPDIMFYAKKTGNTVYVCDVSDVYP